MKGMKTTRFIKKNECGKKKGETKEGKLNEGRTEI